MKVTYKEEPSLFNNIDEFSIECVEEHRRGSSFFQYHIIELKEIDKEYFPEIVDFNKYLGLWKTNTIIYDADWGKDEDFSHLTKVEKIVEKIEKITYKEIT